MGGRGQHLLASLVWSRRQPYGDVLAGVSTLLTWGEPWAAFPDVRGNRPPPPEGTQARPSGTRPLLPFGPSFAEPRAEQGEAEDPGR